MASPKEDDKRPVLLKGKVLVMDDETILRETIGHMLKHLGFGPVDVAANGGEALKLYADALKANQPFDIVILDLMVPGGMGGKETMEKLLDMDPNVTAVISSGYAGEHIITDYSHYGFKGVIAKPYTIDELRECLSEIIQKMKAKP